ncbi:MAG: di-trans,poly-cis-decaprenylcistransferase, partial [Chelatococcus sp.]|uniref:polyprenyl diphosphate synthase n=1 Tax=Chelatococcus sp. TaxID=1953771 RepID=UPI0025C1CB13
PAAEVADLMGLLRHFVRRDLADLHRNNVRVRIIGTDEGLAPDLVGLLTEAENLTRNNTALTLVVAFNYGARQEITQATRRLAADVAAGRLAADDISVERFAEALNTADIPDPDLVIRTSGEQRLSNFLLWQAAYAELVFTPVLWPDFDRGAFEEALSEYQRRERRFGGLSSAAG